MKNKAYFLIDGLFIVIMVMIISLLTMSLSGLEDHYLEIKTRINDMEALINLEYLEMEVPCEDQDLS